MSYSTIRAALDTILANHATAEGVPVAWENTNFEPDLSTPYLSADLLPAQTGDVGLAFGSAEDFAGLYQVTAYVAKGDQTGELRSLVDGVLSAFARGTKNGSVLIEKSHAAPSLTVNDAWHAVPITVRYRLIA